MASFTYVQTRGGLIARKTETVLRPAAAQEEADTDAAGGVTDRWFFDSSFELKHGLVVQEVTPDAISLEAFERLFAAKPA